MSIPDRPEQRIPGVCALGGFRDKQVTQKKGSLRAQTSCKVSGVSNQQPDLEQYFIHNGDFWLNSIVRAYMLVQRPWDDCAF
jgi:hypothetical protein